MAAAAAERALEQRVVGFDRVLPGEHDDDAPTSSATATARIDVSHGDEQAPAIRELAQHGSALLHRGAILPPISSPHSVRVTAPIRESPTILP